MGAGWAEELRAGNITRMEIVVSGYDGPVSVWASSNGRLLPKLMDTDFSLSNPHPTLLLEGSRRGFRGSSLMKEITGWSE
ncbi:MAG: hypothetical protein QXD61_08365 [Candidatus Caldarchaeum sp.]